MMILLATAALAASVSLDGTCSNEVTIDISGLTPGGRAAVLSARGPGSEALGVGPCASSATGLDDSWVLRRLITADAAGQASLSPLLPAPGTCGAHIQVVDASTCDLTNVGVVAQAPLDGFGTISGQCAVLDAGEWDQPAAVLFENTIDFGAAEWDPYQLTDDGLEVILDGNLGGSSLESEATAMELLARCEDGDLLLTEGEIRYLDAGGKKTDLLVDIDGEHVGVSVTRALTFVNPDNRCGTPGQSVANTLTDKLSDIPLSQANAHPDNPWSRSALAVIACDQAHADFVRTTWEGLDPAIKGDTIVLITVTDGNDDVIYQ